MKVVSVSAELHVPASAGHYLMEISSLLACRLPKCLKRNKIISIPFRSYSTMVDKISLP